MRIVADANIILSAILGTGEFFKAQVERSGFAYLLPMQQVSEVYTILTARLGFPDEAAEELIDGLLAAFMMVEGELIVDEERAARERLGEAGQPDWPVLATALQMSAQIWSQDRDFFGVGVAVWSTRNIRFAQPDEEMIGKSP